MTSCPAVYQMCPCCNHDIIVLPPSDQIQQKLEANNVFLIARRQVDVGGTNQELMYMSLKFINNIWVLAEVKVAPGSTTLGVRHSLQFPSYPKT